MISPGNEKLEVVKGEFSLAKLEEKSNVTKDLGLEKRIAISPMKERKTQA